MAKCLSWFQLVPATYAAKSVTGSDIGVEYLYTGCRLDPVAGLQLNRNRYYHAKLGRWINRDPLGYVDGMSLYGAYFVPGKMDPEGKNSIGPAPPVVPGGTGGLGDPLGPHGPGGPSGGGWRWNDRPGGHGDWTKPETGERWHPDLRHPEPKGPHWGYKDPYGNKWDYFPDRDTWQPDGKTKPHRPRPDFPDGTYDRCRPFRPDEPPSWWQFYQQNVIPYFMVPWIL